MRPIYSKISNGQLSDHAQVELAAELTQHETKDIEIKISRRRKKRSLNQNQYYWSIVVPAVRGILVDYGNDVDTEETHSFLKEHVGKLVDSISVKNPDDSFARRAIVKSSAKLTTTEFEAYIERIVRWAATEHVIIPSPNESLYQPIGEEIA